MDIPPSQLPTPEQGWMTDPRRSCIGWTSLYYAPKYEARRAAVITDALAKIALAWCHAGHGR